MQYKTLLFDFDGTVMNGEQGIHWALGQTCKQMGLPMPPQEKLKNFIGPPIHQSFANAGFTDPELQEKMLVIYRKFCNTEEGMGGFSYYDGMEPLLCALKARGLRLAIVSMRTQGSLEVVDSLRHFSGNFDIVYGRQDDHDTNEKSELLLRVISMLGAQKEECALIGDSEYDELGARDAGIDFIGVTYGFGFHSPQEVKRAEYVASSVRELSDYLLKE